MDEIKILWADDEIDTLKPQLFFLKKKGYEVITVSNGHDALDIFRTEKGFDVIFLDESMPGITGLETLEAIREIDANIPVVMITKNEAENLMEEAIGSQINDYLIKPVNPNQILLSLKKIIDNKRLVSEKTATDYQQEFRKIALEISGDLDFEGWKDIYLKIIKWELRMDQNDLPEMSNILSIQKSEANASFFKYVSKNYLSWLDDKSNGPLMSHQLMKKAVLPKMESGIPTFFILLDNLRFDQWKVMESAILEYFNKEEENYFYSLLPSATQYSRNAIFSGLLPIDIAKKYPQWWRNDFEEGGKNMFEAELFGEFIKRNFRKEIKFAFEKVTNTKSAKLIEDTISNYFQNDITVLVYNFIDMLSHARTEMDMLKALASDEKAYRSITLSWLQNSPLLNTLRKLSEKDVRVIITTDHGTIRVNTPSKIVGDKETTTNLRYKSGKNLQYNKKDVYEIGRPEQAGLPSPNVSTRYVFAKEDLFFLYPNNYAYYNSMYKDTFQHGGISLEELICPVIRLRSKGKV
jgi:CheY-like chemotaxis protein